MRKILPQKFFNQPTLKVAQNLLGKFLVRRFPSKSASNQCKSVSIMITEVEAYDGFNDKASHASRGKTERNKTMFDSAGKFYVYFIYGMHWMLNVVTGPKNYPAAILIRAAAEINGPARLTKFLKIDKKFNGLTANKKTGLWFEDRGIKLNKAQIAKSKRIGVEYAGEWANKKYRFFIKKLPKR